MALVVISAWIDLGTKPSILVFEVQTDRSFTKISGLDVSQVEKALTTEVFWSPMASIGVAIHFLIVIPFIIDLQIKLFLVPATLPTMTTMHSVSIGLIATQSKEDENDDYAF